MKEFPSPILFQAQGEAFDPSFFLMMGAIFLIFYFLVIRPQQRQQKEREELVRALMRGDRVITNGGLHGVVTEVADESVTVEIARVKGGARVEVEVSRSGIGSVTRASQAEGGQPT
jgi:preprotein translocase subunit YajC